MNGQIDGQWAADHLPTTDDQPEQGGQSGPTHEQDEGEGKKPTQAQQLVQFTVQAEGTTTNGDPQAELFHTAKQEEYARINVDGHLETWPLKSKAFRRYLRLLYYRKLGSPPASQSIQDAIELLAAIAQFDRPERLVHTRVAEVDGAIWLDLANPTWEAVKVTQTGWAVVSNPPVAFRRPPGMLALPHPVWGGKVDELRPFVNTTNDHDWYLVVAFQVAMLRPRGPYPVLNFLGGQGSAKTTAARAVRDTVDPNVASVRGEPRDLRDRAIAATNSHIAAFDNLSRLPLWLSDGLCRLASGGGFATRELYSDGSEALFDFQRPVMLTGIEELAVRGDLLDRSVLLYLPPIGEEGRRSEKDLWADYERARPRILGALLTAAAGALRRLPTVQLAELPRMADFTEWAVAAAPDLGIAPNQFLDAYQANRDAANELALEASPVGGAVRILMRADTPWSGTATDLLGVINDLVPKEARPAKGWPTTGRAVSNALRRVQPNLRRAGVKVTFGDRESHTRRRLIHLEPVRNLASPASPASPEPADLREQGDAAGTQADGLRPPSSPLRPPVPAGRTAGDAGTEGIRPQSGSTPDGWRRVRCPDCGETAHFDPASDYGRHRLEQGHLECGAAWEPAP